MVENTEPWNCKISLTSEYISASGMGSDIYRLQNILAYQMAIEWTKHGVLPESCLVLLPKKHLSILADEPCPYFDGGVFLGHMGPKFLALSQPIHHRIPSKLEYIQNNSLFQSAGIPCTIVGI